MSEGGLQRQNMGKDECEKLMNVSQFQTVKDASLSQLQIVDEKKFSKGVKAMAKSKDKFYQKKILQEEYSNAIELISMITKSI